MERMNIENTNSKIRSTYKFDFDNGVWHQCPNGVKDIEKGDLFYIAEPEGGRVKDRDGYEIFVAIANPTLHEESGRMQVECLPVPTFKEN